MKNEFFTLAIELPVGKLHWFVIFAKTRCKLAYHAMKKGT